MGNFHDVCLFLKLLHFASAFDLLGREQHMLHYGAVKIYAQIYLQAPAE